VRDFWENGWISERRRRQKNKLCLSAVLLRALAGLLSCGGCQGLSRGVQINLESHKGSFSQFTWVFIVPANPDQPFWLSKSLSFLVQPFFLKCRREGGRCRREAETVALTSPYPATSPSLLIGAARAMFNRDPH